MDNNITNHNMNHSYHKPQTVMDNNITNHNMRLVIAVVHVVVVGYIVVHYCLRFVIAVVHVVVVSYIKPQTVMDNNITNQNNMNHSYHKPQQ
jgi:hypothetical protein